MKRRTFLICGAATIAAQPLWANTSPVLQVRKTPTCGCCTAWVEHVRQAGYTVEAQNVRIRDLSAERSECLLPDLSSSKHTLP